MHQCTYKLQILRLTSFCAKFSFNNPLESFPFTFLKELGPRYGLLVKYQALSKPVPSPSPSSPKTVIQFESEMPTDLCFQCFVWDWLFL